MSARIVLIRGTGDVATAVAHVLFVHGHHVVCHDVASPASSRRGMAFVDAVFGDEAIVDGVIARHAPSVLDVALMLGSRSGVPIVTLDFDTLCHTLGPELIVDARMRKRSIPDRLIGRAALTIGLGPNFIAGETVDVAIETSWGDDLGKVVPQGPTRELAGEPRALDGVGRERFIYTSRAGLFRTERQIGEFVEKGSTVAKLDEEPLLAPLTGVIRGLTRDGVKVDSGTKVVEVDPRGRREAVFGLGERPKQIAAGVLRAINGFAGFAPRLFGFEAGFEPTLQCMPMKVRFNLDACGVKDYGD